MIICFQLEFCLVHPLQPTSRGWVWLQPPLSLMLQLTIAFFALCSLPGTLHGASGGPEGHERQCRRLQVHYPHFCWGLRHCCIMGKRHSFVELRYDHWFCVLWMNAYKDVPFFSIQNVSAVSHCSHLLSVVRAPWLYKALSSCSLADVDSCHVESLSCKHSNSILSPARGKVEQFVASLTQFPSWFESVATAW